MKSIDLKILYEVSKCMMDWEKIELATPASQKRKKKKSKMNEKGFFKYFVG